MKVDLKSLQPYIEEGYIRKQVHDSEPLAIYNYTAKCQYSRKWDDITRMSRGLILDDQGAVVGRCFRKFHNVEEHQADDMPDIPNESFEVYEKWDGSLGISYTVNGQSYLATRGSFNSDQAKYGTVMLHRDKKLCQTILGNSDYTFLFEIIYKENRIVVDYGNDEKLVLLAVIHKGTGKEINIDQFSDVVEVAKRYDFTDLEAIKETKDDNREGYVVQFKSGMRVKSKFSEYLRLHRLLTGASSKSIWDLLRNDESMDEVLERVPDEFFSWVMKTYGDLLSRYREIVDQSLKDFEGIPQDADRRTKAEYIKTTKYPPIVFNMLDGKEYKDIAWKLIKPKYEQPFKEDVDT